MVKYSYNTHLRFATINFLLEAGHIQYQIYNWTAGQECFKKALLMSKLNFELIGLYGKRTKFQQKDIAQLFLKIRKTSLNDKQLQTEEEEYFDKLSYSNHNLNIKHLPKVFLY